MVLSEFAVGRYEVTFDAYDQFAVASGRRLPRDQRWGRGKRPVINLMRSMPLARTTIAPNAAVKIVTQ